MPKSSARRPSIPKKNLSQKVSAKEPRYAHLPQDEVRLIIVGSGGHSNEILSYVQDLDQAGFRIAVVGYIDEGKPRGWAGGKNIIGDFHDLDQFLVKNRSCIYHYLTAIGNNKTRKRFAEEIRKLNHPNIVAWSLIHPQCYIGANNTIGTGAVLAPHATLTTNVQWGAHAILNVHASVSHDCAIGDYANINPGARICGNVCVGTGCYIGAQATIIDKITIGEWTTVGAGAVVIHDLPAHVTAVGVPAQIIKKHQP